MVKKKKLNITTDLLKEDKLYEKETPIQINDKVTLYYAQKFGYDKIDELLIELAETYNFTVNTENVESMDDASVLKYLNFLIVKHFTNLQEATEGFDFYQNIEVSAKAYDKGWIKAVIDELDYIELSKVYDKFYEMVESGEQLMKLATKEQRKLIDTVQSDYLRKKLGADNGKKIIPQS